MVTKIKKAAGNDKAKEFQSKLGVLLYEYSVDEYCVTPHWVIAEYLVRSIINLKEAIKMQNRDVGLGIKWKKKPKGGNK
jgi:hypothetical protein